jgi:hypothetical protein
MAILDYTATQHPDGGVRITLDDPRFGGKEAHFPYTTVEQMAEGAAAYAGGKLIQQAYPFLTPSEREFLMTGMDDADWAEMEAAAEEDDGDELDEDEGSGCPICGRDGCPGYCETGYGVH